MILPSQLPSKFIVRGVGPQEAKIAIVGEQPGVDEARRGVPFVGAAGRELDKILINAGVTRAECYITNVIKDLDHPLKSYIDLSKKSPIITESGQIYINYLKQELEYVKPYVVVALGNIPLLALCSRTGITKWRGSIIESTLVPGLKVVPSIHPATILPPKFQYLNKHLITFDLKRAKNESLFPEIKLTERSLYTRPSFLQAKEFLARARDVRSPQMICFDIEVVDEEFFCFSIGISEHEGISIPFVEGVDYFPLDQEVEIMSDLAHLLEDPEVPKLNHNIDFDCAFMLRKFGIKVAGDLHDTMIAQGITLPDYKKGLDFCCSLHTDIPYYKGAGKKWFKLRTKLEEFWHYSAMDSVAPHAVFKSQSKDLTTQDNWRTYNRQRALIYPLIYMQDRGIRVDAQSMLEGRKEAEAQVKELEEELFRLCEGVINYRSSQQVADYFYRKRGIKPYLDPKTHQETTDANALKRIKRGTASRAGRPEAGLIMKLRTLTTKTLGTYLDIGKIDPDGRYRSQFNPVGTETGRLSSSENIVTNTGGNLQNWPHSLLKYLIADEGYVIYSLDLSQAENRCVAYIGRVRAMIEAFEQGLDLHRLTASSIFNKTYDQVSDIEGSSDIGDGTHSERFWGKKGNHSYNYDIGFKRFALENEILEGEAQTIIRGLDRLYPEVKGVFHAMVQEQLAKNRTLENPFGRRRLFLGEWGHDLFKEAYSQIPQSTVADKINEQGLVFIYYNQHLFKHLELLRQVHDDIGFQIPLSIPWTEHAEILQRVIDSLETPVRWHDREFIIPVDLTMGFSFSKDEDRCREIKAKSRPKSLESFAKKLEESYEELRSSK